MAKETGLEMADPNLDTKVDVQKSFSSDFFAGKSPSIKMHVNAATHPGKKRSVNEDHYAVIRRLRKSEMLMSNLGDEESAAVEDVAMVLLVADGVGGASFGEFASHLAIETILQAAGLATSWIMKVKDLDAQQVRERVAAYVDRIQETFQKQGQLNPEKKQMGTTLTAAYLIPPHAIISHIGDSRAYLFRDQRLLQITHDQTLAQALMDRGAGKEEVKKFGNVLMNNLSGSGDYVEADVIHIGIETGDRLLLCSDGLSDMVDDEAIAETLSSFELESVCSRLVEQAMNGGGRDNITVVVCDLVDASLTDTKELKT